MCWFMLLGVPGRIGSNPHCASKLQIEVQLFLNLKLGIVINQINLERRLQHQLKTAGLHLHPDG